MEEDKVYVQFPISVIAKKLPDVFWHFWTESKVTVEGRLARPDIELCLLTKYSIEGGEEKAEVDVIFDSTTYRIPVGKITKIILRSN